MTETLSSDQRFRRLYDEHFESVRAYCMRRLPVADANDAVAEVFLTAWRKKDAIPTGEERAWLYAVARNKVLHSKRSMARRTRLRQKTAGLASTSQPSPETEIVSHSESQPIREVLDKLPERDREVLQLRAWEELTATQISKVIDASVAATEKRISRAYSKFERALRRSAPELTETHSPKGGER